MPVKPAIIPGLRYRDAPAAIDFLCCAFGFERQAVYPDPADPHIIAHAQLVLDGNMIMLGTHRDGEGQALYGWKTPQQAGGVTSSLYVVIDDVAAHFERAKAGGADLIDEVHDNVGYPGQGYSARDCEGYVWSFGSYDPFAI